jgi:hypothetical protein
MKERKKERMNDHVFALVMIRSNKQLDTMMDQRIIRLHKSRTQRTLLLLLGVSFH